MKEGWKKIHEQAHGTIKSGEKRRCFKTFEPAIANHPPNDGAILLLDEGLIVLLVRAAARKDNARLLAIRLQSLIHEYGVVVGVQSQKRKGQRLAQFGQHRTQQVLLPHEQGRAFRPSGRNIREDESLDETAARRGAAVRDEVGEVYLKIDGRMVYLWRAVDGEGEVLDVLVQTKRNKAAALKLMRKLLKKYGLMPDKIVTDDLRSYGAAARELGSQIIMSAGDGATIGRRIRVSQPDEGRGKCTASRARDPRKDFSQRMPPSTTPSTFNAI